MAPSATAQRITRNCRELAASLATQVARVTVRVPPADDGASVRIGTQSIPPAGWGVPIPVDPGDVTVRASHSRTDAPSSRRSASPAAGSITIDVALAMRAPHRPRTLHRRPRRMRRRPCHRPSHRGTSNDDHGHRPWSRSVGGRGSGRRLADRRWCSLVDARQRDRRPRRGLRRPIGCDPSSIDSNETARSFTLGTNLAMGLGAAAIAGGLTWFFVARSGRGEARALRPSAWVHPGSAGLSFGGAL
jgi:hypothetical protein